MNLGRCQRCDFAMAVYDCTPLWCGYYSVTVTPPKDAAPIETKAEAHARDVADGIATERARWVGWCKRVEAAAKHANDPSVGTGMREAVRKLLEHIGEDP